MRNHVCDEEAPDGSQVSRIDEARVDHRPIDAGRRDLTSSAGVPPGAGTLRSRHRPGAARRLTWAQSAGSVGQVADRLTGQPLFPVKDGYITAPDKPGIGIDPDPEVVKKYRV